MQKYSIALIFIFYSTISYANLIISAFSAIYINLLLPWILATVIISETIVLYYLQQNITVKRAISVVFISNMVSTIAGIFLTNTGLFPKDHDLDTYFFHAYLGVFIAYILSILIEFFVLHLIKNINKSLKCSFLMNSISYVLVVVFLYYLYF